MSKRSREKRTFTIKPAIMHALHKDFQCTDDQIELVMAALESKVPLEVAEHIDVAMDGKYEMPKRGFILDMEDGTEPQHIEITNHPVNCLHHFLVEKYDLDFGHLYWTAIFLHSPQEFFKAIPMLKRMISSKESEVLA